MEGYRGGFIMELVIMQGNHECGHHEGGNHEGGHHGRDYHVRCHPGGVIMGGGHHPRGEGPSSLASDP